MKCVAIILFLMLCASPSLQHSQQRCPLAGCAGHLTVRAPMLQQRSYRNEVHNDLPVIAAVIQPCAPCSCGTSSFFLVRHLADPPATCQVVYCSSWSADGNTMVLCGYAELTCNHVSALLTASCSGGIVICLRPHGKATQRSCPPIEGRATDFRPCK